MNHVAKVRIRRSQFEMKAHEMSLKKNVEPGIKQRMNVIKKQSDELKKLINS